MNPLSLQTEREFDFNDDDFKLIARIVFEKTGIHLAPHKKNMVYSRIAKRIRRLNLNSFSEYCTLITSNNDGGEMMDFINAVTTNLTHFFREIHHFKHLAEAALPEAIKQNSSFKRLRIWSAGCSSGMEAYSIAMTLRSVLKDVDNWDAKILATDIDTNMLAKGSAGIYSDEEYENIPAKFREEFITKDSKNSQIKVSDKLKKLVSFKRLNFIEPWPVKGPFDIVFCRNVVIYFQKETQKKIFENFSNVMRSGSHLYIGHSENLTGISNKFQLIGKTIYQKI
ncbi:MAG: protein-glutamate O-methyltransferase CheR [Rickettsiales bacterium]|nr:protein-glutamate O-methyltransferase CheR [Rickettsiales bacterium]